MIREELRLTPLDLPEAQLQALHDKKATRATMLRVGDAVAAAVPAGGETTPAGRARQCTLRPAPHARTQGARSGEGGGGFEEGGREEEEGE